LRQLRHLYPNELVIIGAHAAKFPTEKATENIRAAMARQGIQHPVVNDPDFQVWSQYGVRAWPTVVLIDPRGKVVAAQSGEIDADQVATLIQSLLREFDARHELDRTPLGLEREPAEQPDRLLNYPTKVLAASDRRLFIADTGHHRILCTQLSADGLAAAVLYAFGRGEPGLQDGSAAEARFHQPRGMALVGDTLYVADTGNHAIRAVDLARKTVRTVAGTSEKGWSTRGGPTPAETPLRSPWALAAVADQLLIAMAGSHQIWRLTDAKLDVFAGAGMEALVDGPLARAGFNQPSDLALDDDVLFVADAEASAIRMIALAPGEPGAERHVSTLVGEGLFAFGDRDGVGPEVRLQHPTGLAARSGTIYIADSYNHKIKTLDPAIRRVRTLIGSGQPGWVDGPFATAQLHEPEGLAPVEQHLYIADTNNHCVRVADLPHERVHTLRIEHSALDAE